MGGKEMFLQNPGMTGNNNNMKGETYGRKQQVRRKRDAYDLN